MDLKERKRNAALKKELAAVEKQEQKLQQAALAAKPAAWKTELESRLPENVYGGLNSAFCKGFSLVFDQGRGIIEKGYSKENIEENHAVRDYAFQIKGGRRELKQIRKSAKQSDFLNLAATTVEGIGLGALGIGMPDIVLFLATLLKGVYETALNYGFSYDTRQEQLLILKMLAAALSTGEDWRWNDSQVEAMLDMPEVTVTEEEFETQLKATADLFAMDMLLLKFVQGLPVVGIVGGFANPVYYSKVMKYVQVKYRKRYLNKQMKKLSAH